MKVDRKFTRQSAADETHPPMANSEVWLTKTG